MAQSSTSSALLLLVVLLGPMPVLTQRETRHEKFLRQHVNLLKASSDSDLRRYCSTMMQRRGMTVTACKPTNTFIHGTHSDVDAICRDGGTHFIENYYDSHASFPLTTCRIRGGSQSPPCNYQGRISTQRVRVACLNEEPVHFKTPL